MLPVEFSFSNFSNRILKLCAKGDVSLQQNSLGKAESKLKNLSQRPIVANKASNLLILQNKTKLWDKTSIAIACHTQIESAHFDSIWKRLVRDWQVW